MSDVRLESMTMLKFAEIIRHVKDIMKLTPGILYLVL
jgi:hypothetical protein